MAFDSVSDDEASSFKDKPPNSAFQLISASVMAEPAVLEFPSLPKVVLSNLSSNSKGSGPSAGAVEVCLREEPLGFREAERREVEESLETRDRDEALGE
jgi:hypothetical protein